jgi:excisionase family DNA binding protein
MLLNPNPPKERENAMTMSPTGPADEVTDQQLQTPFLSVRAVAEILDVSRQTVYDAIKRDEIPSIRLGKTIRIPTSRFREEFQL